MEARLLIFLFIGLVASRPDPQINVNEDREDNPDERGDLFEGDMVIDFDPDKRNAIKTRLWPNARIPYQIDPAAESQFTATDKSRIQQAIDDYNKYTCIRWVKKTSTDAAYVNIIRGGGCYSSVGRTSRKQNLSLGRGCTGKGTIIHEMMHASGFHHEQCRTDRDDHVIIKYDNISPGKENNFRKYTVQQVQDLGAPYDYGSIMHYSSKAFSKNGQATIVQIRTGTRIGNRAGFSDIDIFKLNKLYNCPNGVTLPPWAFTKYTGTVATTASATTAAPKVVIGKFNCNFDSSDCGFAQDRKDKFDWTRKAGNTPTSNTGPTTDHTSGKGYYMYIEASSPRVAGDNARIISPEIQGITGTYCVKFWYHMYGSSMGSLNVYETKKGSSTARKIYTKTGNQGNKWLYDQVQSSTTSSFMITFEGTRGSQITGDAAVDDVSITPGSCPAVITTPATKPTPTTKPTTTKSTTKVTVPTTTPKPVVLTSDLKCTFDQNTCNFIQNKDDQFNWSWKQGGTSSQNTGPTGDHTSGSGKYMYIETSNPRVANDKARLSSPMLSFNGQYCLSFAYHMFGSLQGTLNVYIKSGTSEQLIFSTKGDKGNQWFTAQRNVAFSSTSQIIFEGIRGNGFTSDSAIDDVSIIRGSCVVTTVPIRTTTTTVGPTTPVGQVLNGGFSCNFDNGLCGMNQNKTDVFDWTVHQGSTPSSSTGPIADHTTGKGRYIYTEASSPRVAGDYAAITTPTIKFSTSIYCVDFWYHMFGINIGTLTVSAITSKKTTPFFRKTGNQNNTWHHAAVQVTYVEPVKIKFDGIRGNGWAGDIAVDDVKISPGRCISTVATTTSKPTTKPTTPKVTILKGGFNCNFDSTFCNMIQNRTDKFDWTRRSGSTPSQNTGPSKDHTSGTGKYIYIEASSPRVAGHAAQLITPTLTDLTKVFCVQFWYHMYGTGMGTLNVYEKTSTKITNIFNKSRINGDVWMYTGIQRTYSNPVQIVFEGIVGTTWSSDIALDDIRITPGVCPDPPKTVATTPSTTSKTVVTTPTTPHTTSPATFTGKEFNCNFDNNMCGFVQRASDVFDWTLKTGKTTSSNTGPLKDHTTGTGKYMYIEASSPRVKGNNAQLVSPAMIMTGKHCVQFWYHMQGSTMGTLKVSITDMYGKKDIPLLVKSGNQGSDWLMFQKEYDMVPGDQIYFEGVVGSSWSGDIAVDDVKVYPGQCTVPTRFPPGVLFLCDFEKNTCDLTSTKIPTNSSFRWIRHRGNTSSQNTGPSKDHTLNSAAGYYIYTEASSPAVKGDRAFLDTPSITTPGTETCLEFYYHMFGNHLDSLNVYAKTPSSLGTPIFTDKNSKGTQWLQKKITITKKDLTSIRFESIRGNGFMGDMALDDISLKLGPCV